MEAEFVAGRCLTGLSSLERLPFFLCFSTRGKHSARMASLTSSSWIIDLARCFGWIGDGRCLTSFSQCHLQPFSPLGDQSTGDLPRRVHTTTLTPVSLLCLVLQNWSGWSWTGEDEEPPTFSTRSYVTPFFQFASTSPLPALPQPLPYIGFPHSFDLRSAFTFPTKTTNVPGYCCQGHSCMWPTCVHSGVLMLASFAITFQDAALKRT